uniref:Uncharacterized protein n=1 Tax=Cucumis melo TaxID=3656 RepID=A0A9I9EB24_CUCME
MISGIDGLVVMKLIFGIKAHGTRTRRESKEHMMKKSLLLGHTIWLP